MERVLPTRKRSKASDKVNGGGNYFASPKTDVDFISSGCTMLDLALGGGWAEQRIINIIGDKSSGKTLLCIEAAANFAIKYPKGKIRYREAESAFLPQYAGALGMPLDRVDFGRKQLETIEDFYEDLERVVQSAKTPELYILDSLDSLSDRAEMKRDIDEGSYGTRKAAQMSQLFRRLTSQMQHANLTLMIVSQIRDKIGVTWGKKTTRSGGRALDFYASQVVSLAQLVRIVKTVQGTKRPKGVEVLAKCDKNKVSLAYREAQFDILFGYGIDDGKACLDWLHTIKQLKLAKIKPEAIKEYSDKLKLSEHKSELQSIRDVVKTKWYEIEQELMPKERKYK